MNYREIINDLERARKYINSASRRLPFGSCVTLSMLSEAIEEQQLKFLKEVE